MNTEDSTDAQYTVTVDLQRRREMSNALRRSSLLLALFALNTLLVTQAKWFRAIDDKIGDRGALRLKGMNRLIVIWLDNLGLRGLSATVLLIAALAISIRFKSWRPLNLALLSLIALNLVVGALKIIIGRSKPLDGVDNFDVSGVGSYPSGHAANAILTWGVLAYLIYRYTHRAIHRATFLTVAVSLVTGVVAAVSLYRNTHWLSDLIGGILIGAALLVLVMAVDRFVPSAKQPVQP